MSGRTAKFLKRVCEAMAPPEVRAKARTAATDYLKARWYAMTPRQRGKFRAGGWRALLPAKGAKGAMQS